MEVKVKKFEIVCPNEQMLKIEEHCFSETQIEVGGFLIGRVEENKTTITAAVAATHTIGQSTQLTFTHDTWDAIYKFMENLPADEKLIGWYHSHPNFGVFLSDHDQFIQNNFFKGEGQITIVVDPIRGRRGWFRSVDGKIVSYEREVDTIKKKLGVSSTDADANMDIVLGTRASSASNLKIIGISGIMAIVSFIAGLLMNNLNKSNFQTMIGPLQTQVAYLQHQIDDLKNATSLSVTTTQPKVSEGNGGKSPDSASRSTQPGSSAKKDASTPTPKGSSTSTPTPKGSSTSSTTPKGPSTSSTTPKGPSTSSTTPKGPSTSSTTPKGPSTSSTTTKEIIGDNTLPTPIYSPPKDIGH
jgi:proteasome lid subunit RPN8/RPN11